MKILFLDHDSVICLYDQFSGRFKKQMKYSKENPNISRKDYPVSVRFDNFDKKAIKVLNEIIEETNCEIVVSSDWKHHATLEEMGDYYTEQGIIKRPIDFTPRFKDIIPRKHSMVLRWRSAKLEIERTFEINHWIENHPEVTQWVAVDDLNMSTEHLMGKFHYTETPDKPEDIGVENFVHIPRQYEGIKQSGIKEKILKYLL